MHLVWSRFTQAFNVTVWDTAILVNTFLSKTVIENVFLLNYVNFEINFSLYLIWFCPGQSLLLPLFRLEATIERADGGSGRIRNIKIIKKVKMWINKWSIKINHFHGGNTSAQTTRLLVHIFCAFHQKRGGETCPVYAFQIYCSDLWNFI